MVGSVIALVVAASSVVVVALSGNRDGESQSDGGKKGSNLHCELKEESEG